MERITNKYFETRNFLRNRLIEYNPAKAIPGIIVETISTEPSCKKIFINVPKKPITEILKQITSTK